MDGEMTTSTQTTETVATTSAETSTGAAGQAAGAENGNQEKASAFKDFLDGLFGTKQEKKETGAEEKAAEEQKKKDDQIADLQAKLLKSDLQKKATASLEKDGYPVGLADLLDYTSEEAMEKSLSKLIETFKGSLQTAVESRLRGKTPAGLGNAASAENMLRDQIARNIRGL